MFHTQIWVQNNPLHLIVDNGSHKNFVSESLVKKLGLVTTLHPRPYHISWMKDGQELKITRQCKLDYFINPFKDEVLCDVVQDFFVSDALFNVGLTWKLLGTTAKGDCQNLQPVLWNTKMVTDTGSLNGIC